MLNLDTAVLPSPVIPDAPAASADANTTPEDSALFSLALENETQKALVPAGILAGVGGLLPAAPAGDAGLPTVPVAPEAADKAEPAKDPKRPEESDNLSLLPSLLALVLNEPRWQNMPSPAKPDSNAPADSKAQETPKAEPSPIAAPATPVRGVTPVASPSARTVQATERLPELASSANETGFGDREAAAVTASTSQPEERPSSARVVQQDPQKDDAAMQTPRVTAEPTIKDVRPLMEVPTMMMPAGNVIVAEKRPSPDAADAPDAPVDQTVPAKESEEQPVAAVPQPAKETAAKTAESMTVAVEGSLKRDASDARVRLDQAVQENTVIHHEVAASSPAKEASAPRKTQVHGETNSAAETEKSESAVAPASVPAAAVVTDASHQDLNREARQPGHEELEIEVTVRSATKEIERPGRPAFQIRPEEKTAELSQDLRTASTVLHEMKGQTPEFARAQEAAAIPGSEHWSQVEKSNVFAQIVEKARSLRWDRDSEIVVSLKPESLGRISMRASLVDRTMVATIAAESEKVRQLIQVELPVIQRALQESGISSKVVVTQQNDVSLNYSSQSNGQPRFRQSAPELSMGREVEVPQPAATPDVADSRYSTHSVHLIA